MNKKIILLSVLACIWLFSTNANAFYVGASLGEAKTKVDGNSTDEGVSFSLYSGMTIPLPLIPIRGEIEYMQLNSNQNIGDVKTYGLMANAYIGIPLIPIINPYVGMGLGYLRQDIGGFGKSDWKFTPQYMLGFDVSLAFIPITAGIEYRYIDADFTNNVGEYKSEIHALLLKVKFEF